MQMRLHWLTWTTWILLSSSCARMWGQSDPKMRMRQGSAMRSGRSQRHAGLRTLANVQQRVPCATPSPMFEAPPLTSPMTLPWEAKKILTIALCRQEMKSSSRNGVHPEKEDQGTDGAPPVNLRWSRTQSVVCLFLTQTRTLAFGFLTHVKPH